MCQQSPNLEAFNLEEAIISSHRALSTAKDFPPNEVAAISRKHSLKPLLLCLEDNESLKSCGDSCVKLRRLRAAMYRRVCSCQQLGA